MLVWCVEDDSNVLNYIFVKSDIMELLYTYLSARMIKHIM